MDKKGKYSSSLKVGFLTLISLSILIFTVLWVKGRSLSSGERIEIAFNDINGMRAGSQVQMMGLRIGQVEEILPVIQGKDSYVKLRFVVTEKGVKIPYASTISIQQSGIIGEQFLEVTPPKIENIYSETTKTKVELKPNQPIFMQLSTGMIEIGKVIDAELIKKSQLPYEVKQKVDTKNAVKLSYMIDLPGLILDKDMLGFKIEDDKVTLFILDGEIPEAPRANLKYTVIEPMRLADFMDLQFRAARSLSETNDKITEILSEEFIGSLKSSVTNIEQLTRSANTTLEKATLLIDSSKVEIEGLISQSEELVKSLTTLSNNVNELVSDEALVNDIVSSIKSIGKTSEKINTMLEDEQTKEIIANINEATRNINEISSYVNEYTKDEKLKEEIRCTIESMSVITSNIAKIMNDYNKLEDDEKLKLRGTIKDITTITKNVKKFSEKLNKRFLLFRLMF